MTNETDERIRRLEAQVAALIEIVHAIAPPTIDRTKLRKAVGRRISGTQRLGARRKGLDDVLPRTQPAPRKPAGSDEPDR